VKFGSCQAGFSLLVAATAALGLAGGIAYATNPFHIVSIKQGVGYRPRVDYRVDGYRPKPVPPEELPDYQNYVTPLNGTQPVDSQGVALWPFNGRMVYHPLVIARYGVKLLHSYRITHSPGYLDRAEVNAAFLINHAVSRNGALFFPYRFSYHLFGRRSDLMRPPWYSAMAQGAALTLFLRLNLVTGEQRWRTAADSTFATFVQRRSARQPWIVFVFRRDDRRYLWLEEYPKDPPTQPLNGDMYALFGVWEYAFATGSAAARHVFDGAATAIRHQVYRFRVPGGISYYSLRVHVQYASYHCIHVWQLELLGRMTGDPWLVREGLRFAADGRHASVHC
jgi:D-glucuronyl C5-epimerase C-terminus